MQGGYKNRLLILKSLQQKLDESAGRFCLPFVISILYILLKVFIFLIFQNNLKVIVCNT